MINDRIEQVLRVWELCCVLSKISVKKVNMLKFGEAADMFTGPLKHSESFRNDILLRKPFDAGKYIANGLNAEWLGVFSYFPASVHAWATASRRIYRLDGDIQELILQTDVSQLTWNDIVFPFGAFGIALSRPIREPGGQLFDFLLVHRGWMHSIGRDGITIWAISQEYERPMLVSLKLAQRIYEDMVAKGKLKKADEISNSAFSKEGMEKSALGAKLNSFIADSAFFDRPLKDTFSYVKANEGKVAQPDFLPLHRLPTSSMEIEVERVVAGLCVYLDVHRNTSKSAKVKTDWKPRDEPTIDANCVAKEALVCSVQNVYDITELERELLLIPDPVERRKRCEELGVHYREGYARRRPGFGNDPDALRCVHVRPAIVGLRRLAPGALPRGTEKVL